MDRETFHENCLSLLWANPDLRVFAIVGSESGVDEFDDSYLATLGEKASPKCPHSTPSLSQNDREHAAYRYFAGVGATPTGFR
jgi:hypothetical protein